MCYKVGASLSHLFSFGEHNSPQFPWLLPSWCTQTLDISVHESAPAPSYVWRPFVPPVVLLLFLPRCRAARSYQVCITPDLKPWCWGAALTCGQRQCRAEETDGPHDSEPSNRFPSRSPILSAFSHRGGLLACSPISCTLTFKVLLVTTNHCPAMRRSKTICMGCIIQERVRAFFTSIL